MSLLNSGDGPSPQDFSLNKGKNSLLFRKFKGFVKERALLDGVSSVLVALSGGPDSICLLHLLYLLSKTQDIKLHAAHFNHMLRGEEAERDADFAKKVCEANQIPFYLGAEEVACFAKEKKLCVQEAARILRYKFLKDTAASHGIEAIATGHTADDQAEELLFRFLRGSSLTGLSGIRPKRADGIIRPILFARKIDIVRHLNSHDIPFVTDSSNIQNKYARNKIRNVLLPLLQKEFNPSIVETLSRSAYLFQDDEDALNHYASHLLRKVIVYPDKNSGTDHLPDLVILDTEPLSQAKSAILRRVLLLATELAGIDRGKILSDHLLKLEHLAMERSPSGHYNLPDGFCASRIYRHIAIFRKELCNLKNGLENQLERLKLIKAPGTLDLGEYLGTITLTPRPMSNQEGVNKLGGPYPRPLFIKLDANTFPLQLRFKKQGDRFRPLGMKEHVKLKDFFIGRHVPKILREAIPLLVRGSEIAAVCGIEIGDEFRVENGHALEIIWQPSAFVKTIFSLGGA
ncbi:MAG: tRNA lysidine(34) synthetase TilS [Thermodesulfobacteria bacterium]|nr:tRNA lysidine(34) synthetase TilS [Thermodesulfobacteriota bacterium]